MKIFFNIFLVLAITKYSFATDSLQIVLNRVTFVAKDTIEFSCTIPNHSSNGLAGATLNVWIQHLQTGRIWKYRYPVINGELNAALAVGDSIMPGKYALNFILQEGLFKINGNLKNNYGYPKLNYLMLTRNKESLFNAVNLSGKGDFRIQNVVFPEEAYFIFSPAKKTRCNDLFIKLVTPLDSFFTPIAVFTSLIDIKSNLHENSAADTHYQFNFSKLFNANTLPEVVVEYKGSTRLKRYDEEYTTSLFKGATKIFDGLDDKAIANSSSVERFLEARVAGIRMENNRLVWRNQPVNIFLDEYVVNSWEDIYVNTMDVAMIKIYEPGSGSNPSANQGGTVSVYTKRGPYENIGQRYKFKVNGYTPIEATWR